MAIEVLRPNAAGDETKIATQYPSSTYHWDKVDEVSADGYTTRVQTVYSDTYTRDLYNIDDHSVGSGDIARIKVYAVCMAANTPTQASLIITIKSGTGNGAPDTVDEDSAITITADWAGYSNIWATNPATGNEWTWDEIDKLQIGASIRQAASGDRTYLTQVYVEVDYTPGEAEDVVIFRRRIEGY